MKYLTPPVFWPVWIIAQRSQRRACRNAMVASTALTALRHEREDTEEFVGEALSRRDPVAEAVLPGHDRDAVRLG
jgi:hypothetical protein